MFDTKPRVAARSAACLACPARRSAQCCGLTLQDVAALKAMARDLSFAPRVALLEEGELAEHVFTILSGMALLSKTLSDGRRQVLAFAIPGDLIGLVSLRESTFTAIAITPLTTRRTPRRALTDLMARSPVLTRQMQLVTAGELNIAQDHMALLGRGTADQRVATFLLLLQERWSHRAASSCRIDLPMSRQDIGDYLGLTVETVSRTITRLAKSRAFAIVPNGVRILDHAKLVDIAGSFARAA